MCGHFSTKYKVDFDYTEYLGEGYKENFKEISKVPTMICNHVSWLDTQILLKYFNLSFTLAKPFKKVPLFGTLAQTIDTIFIERGGSAEDRHRTIEII